MNAEEKSLDGIIPVYKEKGFTSFDVVAKLRKILGIKRIGHTGTLDPDACGVLTVCTGKATKLVERLTDSPKEYKSRFLFGLTTDTQDISGKIISENEVSISAEELKEIIFSFKGEYEQTPPMYSALKVNGKKLYELAREGKTVERRARVVHIYDIGIDDFDISCNEPFADVTVKCSKGTYIRTLADDIGMRAGCGACMKTLLRTEAAGFKLSDCLTLSEIEGLVSDKGAGSVIIPVENCFLQLCRVDIKPEHDRFLYNGNALYRDFFENVSHEEYNELRVYDSNGVFKAVYKHTGDCYKPLYMF